MIWTVPNMLTSARLLAAPGLAVPFLLLPRPEADLWALGLFLAAAVTDFFDGWLARRLGQESRLGAVLDPIADKVTVAVGLAVVLAHAPDPGAPLLLLPAALILFREGLVSGLREAVGGTALKVTVLAKWKTTAQMVAIAALLAAPAAPPHLAAAGANGIAAALLWIAALLTLITGWDYAAKALRYMREREDG